MRIRPVANDQEIRKAHEIESIVYTKESAATLEAFQMRKQVFGSYFLVAEIESEHEIVGVTNGVKLHHRDLADESIKQGVEFAVNGQYFCLLTIAVLPTYQRRGIATALLKSVIRIAREEGLKGIVLMCEEHLISFYEQHGFRYAAPSASVHGGIQWHEMNLLWK
ncbi:Ribosomal protein S18 acetylase RimI [Paenibacillus sp. yr247]|uniref:GNAT family N-acetyltransferase n=1 Tax=Paenibacillus sp. yr247 TaxID=1761880 RepID=UPI00087F2165|nr:GNAT family N-acetyltransferase [Paenibacillus sp. yr247]SDO27182.1 Ribosomal protein S18 acetylase RimI [Paenibacillus sp. yr247]